MNLIEMTIQTSDHKEFDTVLIKESTALKIAEIILSNMYYIGELTTEEDMKTVYSKMISTLEAGQSVTIKIKDTYIYFIKVQSNGNVHRSKDIDSEDPLVFLNGFSDKFSDPDSRH